MVTQRLRCWRLLLLAVCGTVQAEGQLPEVTFGNGAKLVGTYHGDTVPAFLGIRFAKAQRFGLPEMVELPGASVTNASSMGEECVMLHKADNSLVGSEDCLSLNIWAPDLKLSEPKAVMVYIHGGALVTGSAQETLTLSDMVALVTEGGIVLVLIHYRTNILGFFTAPGIEAPTNFAFRDQIVALQWVQKHIGSFGGDPNKVTIFGESAGGLSVLALFASPLARGLFQGGIAQSPGFVTPSQLWQPSSAVASSMGLNCLHATGCFGAPDKIACLRELPLRTLVESCRSFMGFNTFLGIRGMHFAGWDGEVVPSPIWQSYCSDLAEDPRPLIVGSLPHEWRAFEALGLLPDWHSMSSDADQVLDRFLYDFLPGYEAADALGQECAVRSLLSFYKDAPDRGWLDRVLLGSHTRVQAAGDALFTVGAQLAAASQSPKSRRRYRYLVDIEEGGGVLGATHVVDLCYLAKDPDTSGVGLCGRGVLAEEKRSLGRTLREYWTSFAKTGVPSAKNGPRWDPVNGTGSSSGLPMLRFHLDRPSEMTSAPWFSEPAAALMESIVCGRRSLRLLPDGDCEFAGPCNGTDSVPCTSPHIADPREPGRPMPKFNRRGTSVRLILFITLTFVVLLLLIAPCVCVGLCMRCMRSKPKQA